MTKKQFKKKFGTEGTQKSRKQMQKAISRDKTPNQFPRSPFHNPDKRRLTRAEKLLEKTYKKLNRTT